MQELVKETLIEISCTVLKIYLEKLMKLFKLLVAQNFYLQYRFESNQFLSFSQFRTTKLFME